MLLWESQVFKSIVDTSVFVCNKIIYVTDTLSDKTKSYKSD